METVRLQQGVAASGPSQVLSGRRPRQPPAAAAATSPSSSHSFGQQTKHARSFRNLGGALCGGAKEHGKKNTTEMGPKVAAAAAAVAVRTVSIQQIVLRFEIKS